VAADPDFWKQTVEHRNTVNRLMYSQSPQAIPAGYDPVREAEEILRQRQATLPPSNPKAPSLWQQIRGITVKSALSTAPRALGTIGLVRETFVLGWKIGEGINAKFLRIGLPDPEPYYGDNPGLRLSLSPHICPSGQAQCTLWSSVLPVPNGWVYSWADDDPVTRDGFYFGTEPAVCLVPPPDGIRIGRDTTLNPPTCKRVPVPSVSHVLAYLGENGLPAVGPVEDYTGQPYTKSSPAPAPPPQTTVEQSIETEVGQPENALLRQWLNYELGSPGEQDPLGIGAPNPEIEFPGFVEHWEEHGDEFTPAYVDPVEYWRDAADIVERGTNNDPAILHCERLSDGALIYWDSVKRAIVIVKGGKIVTFFKPPGPPPADFDYWFTQCGS
jgi:hypothetical protein